MKAFDALEDKLVAQYDAYQPLPGMNLKGRLTLGENSADLAGLSAAYDAYHASLGGKPAPVIGGMTGDQRFYLGWAQVWRRNYREAGAPPAPLDRPALTLAAAGEHRAQHGSLVRRVRTQTGAKAVPFAGGAGGGFGNAQRGSRPRPADSRERRLRRVRDLVP